MTETPVDLDAHRGFASMKATEIRRQRLYEFQLDQEALRVRQDELEQALTQPAECWEEAAVKAQYLIQLFAATADAQEPQRQALIERTLDDLAKLCESSKERP
jgi:transcription termination factor NusB